MKKPAITLLLTLLSSSIYGNICEEVLKPFTKKYFIETGTFGGLGIDAALACGFEEVRTIDIDKSNTIYTRENHSQYNNITYYIGDSGKLLGEMIQDIDEPVTFWLDAHNYPGEEGKQNCPLMEELEFIKNHPVKTHTILIDDMSCAGTIHFDYITKDMIKEKIKEINPDYTIYFVAGGGLAEVPDNILVAEIQ